VTKATDKTLHLFDSFEGISAPGPDDQAVGGPDKNWKKGMLAVEENTVRDNLDGFRLVEIHRGWIPERFSDVGGSRFCLVHIDLDLHRPTHDSLEFFYPRLNPGGVIVCDDYGSGYCPGARKACDDFVRDKPESVLHLPTGQGLIIKR
jgi:hypothetical protein